MVGTQMPDLDNLELHTRRHIEQDLAESMVLREYLPFDGCLC